MDFGIANGSYLGTDFGLAPGVQYGLNVGLGNGLYNELLINRGIERDGLIFYVDAGIRSSYVGSGAAWNDLTASALNGTLTNTPVFSTLNQGGIVFNGSNNSSSFGNVLQLGTNSRTYCVWYKSNTTTQQDFATLFSKTDDGSTAYRQSIGFRANGNFYIVFRGAANFSYDSTITNRRNDLNWHYLVWVIDRSSSYYLYQDGFLLGSSDISSASGQDFQLNRPFRIGSYTSFATGNPVNFYNGIIGSVKVYNRALSIAEITQNYVTTKYIYNR